MIQDYILSQTVLTRLRRAKRDYCSKCKVEFKEGDRIVGRKGTVSRNRYCYQCAELLKLV